MKLTFFISSVKAVLEKDIFVHDLSLSRFPSHDQVFSQILWLSEMINYVT